MLLSYINIFFQRPECQESKDFIYNIVFLKKKYVFISILVLKYVC